MGATNSGGERYKRRATRVKRPARGFDVGTPTRVNTAFDTPGGVRRGCRRSQRSADGPGSQTAKLVTLLIAVRYAGFAGESVRRWQPRSQRSLDGRLTQAMAAETRVQSRDDRARIRDVDARCGASLRRPPDDGRAIRRSGDATPRVSYERRSGFCSISLPGRGWRCPGMPATVSFEPRIGRRWAGAACGRAASHVGMNCFTA